MATIINIPDKMLVYEILECSSWVKWPSQSMLCVKIHLLLTVFKVNKHYITSPADSANLVQKSGFCIFRLTSERTRSEHACLHICYWFEESLEPLRLNLSVWEAHTYCRLVFTDLLWDLLASCHTGDRGSSLCDCEGKVCQMSMTIYHVCGKQF